jgi:hypothetical protein
MPLPIRATPSRLAKFTILRLSFSRQDVPRGNSTEADDPDILCTPEAGTARQRKPAEFCNRAAVSSSSMSNNGV